MFCAGCGTQIQSGLNYCSRCGRRITDDSKSEKFWTGPLSIAGNVAFGGLVSFIFVVLILTRGGTPPDLLLKIIFLYLAALFGICFMIMRYGRTTSERPRPTSDQLPTAAYLRPVTTAQLDEAREFGVGSVTDATTRTLDEVPVGKRQS